MEKRSIIKSFNYAIDGIIYALRTQRNIRVHLTIAFIVLFGSLLIGIPRTDFLILALTITMVLVSEMINTAVESAIDVTTTTHDPLAKIAKDVAAGAVLVSSINAIVVGYLVFFSRLAPYTLKVLLLIRKSPVHITFIGLLLLIILVIVTKAIAGYGTPLRGGLPSGHSAIAFFIFISITYLVNQMASIKTASFISILVLLMAILVSQSRIEAGIHNYYEVVIGAILGIIVAILMFQVLYIYI